MRTFVVCGLVALALAACGAPSRMGTECIREGSRLNTQLACENARTICGAGGTEIRSGGSAISCSGTQSDVSCQLALGLAGGFNPVFVGCLQQNNSSAAFEACMSGCGGTGGDGGTDASTD